MPKISDPFIEYMCDESYWKTGLPVTPTRRGLISGKLAFFHWFEFEKYHGGAGGIPRYSLFQVRIDRKLSSPNEKDIAVLRDFRLNPGAAMASAIQNTGPSSKSTGIITIKGAHWDIEYAWRGVEYLSFLLVISVRREDR